jgi:hypothetical protein
VMRISVPSKGAMREVMIAPRLRAKQ